MKFYIWNIGCQMNESDAWRVSSTLEDLGYEKTGRAEQADLIILNTCVVRKSAEDKAIGRLTSISPLKKHNPGLVINLMGCMVGIHNNQKLKERFPFVDVFSPPSDLGPLIAYLSQKRSSDQGADGEFISSYPSLSPHLRAPGISTFIPVVLGCSHACTFCVIPYRRGIERSRSLQEIFTEVNNLAKQGVKEITLLGQIVDRFGKDLGEDINLAKLLRHLHDIDELERIRFLTSHPNWMTIDLLETIASLPKVMPHIEVPVQSGDDEVLSNMQRGYTADKYIQLITQVRRIIPSAAIANDIIVGFPGETEDQYQRTFDLVAHLRLDSLHLARYSERPGTLAARKMVDNIPEDEKWRRYRLIETLHEQIATEINARYFGQTVAVLFEDMIKGRWVGRTPTNKIVFIDLKDGDGLVRETYQAPQIDTNEDLRGKIMPVIIRWTGAWSMRGILAPSESQITMQ